MSESSFFELIVASELLKSFDLSIDELRDGLVGGGMDGGIDGLFVLVDGDPVSAAHLDRVDREFTVDVVIFQAKTSPSFSGTALDKLISTLSTLFDLGREDRELRRLYSEDLMERATLFRRFYLRHFARISRMTFKVYYATRGEAAHSALSTQVSTIENVSQRLFPAAETSFSFVGAADLLAMLRKPRAEWLELKLSEDALNASGGGFIALARLSDFAQFITDEEGNRRRRLFLENVRDFEGDNVVNRAIASTLEETDSVNFWMLNNGVTIVAEDVRQAYRVLGLREPKIVNGLQTSTVLYEHFRNRDLVDDRTVLVRIVVPPDATARDRIIVATNSQTDIKPAVLRATDRLQKDIEVFFSNTELVYERQRNAYKNYGVQLGKIVTMPLLGRSLASTLLQEPHLAARVNAQTRLLAGPRQYYRIFAREYPLAMYLASARITKRVEGFLGDRSVDSELTDDPGGRRPQLWYTQWHVAMAIVFRAVPGWKVTSQALAELDVQSIPDDEIADAIRVVNKFFTEARRDYRRTIYQLTKSQALTEVLLARLKADGSSGDLGRGHSVGSNN